MRKLILTTTGAINWTLIENMVKNGPNALVLFQLIPGTGYAADPYRENLLNATIIIEDPYSVAGTVTFSYPEGKEVDVKTSDYNFDLNPLEIKFNIKAGDVEGAYKITREGNTNNWHGFYSVNGEYIYALKGTIEERK